jgi:Zn-dependent peptidase ImmA (M78 family)
VPEVQYVREHDGVFVRNRRFAAEEGAQTDSKRRFTMSYLEDEDFERAAQILRVKFGIDDQLRLDVIDILRKLKHHGQIIDYVRVPDMSLPEAEAQYDPDKGIIYLRESTYQAALQGNRRARWTVAHEIGHVTLNHQRTRNRSSTLRSIEKIAQTIRRDEAQAHKFAAALLAPFHRANFSLQTTAQQVATRFDISLDAANRRIEEFTRIYRRLNGLARPLPSSVIDFLKAAQRKGHMIKNLALADFISALGTSPRYEGDACPSCNEFKLVRSGIGKKCDGCGAITGDD